MYALLSLKSIPNILNLCFPLPEIAALSKCRPGESFIIHAIWTEDVNSYQSLGKMSFLLPLQTLHLHFT